MSATLGPLLPDVCGRPAASMPSSFATSTNLRAVVAEHAVQIAVLVADEDVEVAVLIHVEPDGADGRARIVDAHLLADARERLAVVAEEHVRRVAEADEEIEVAVVVEVDERRLPRLAGRVDAHRLRHLDERLAGALVAIEPARNLGLARESDEQVDVAVAVEVAPRRGARVVEIGDAELRGDVRERAVVVAIETVRLALPEADEQIEVAVVVEVGPAVRLTAGGGEEIRLDELEARRGSGLTSSGLARPLDPDSCEGCDQTARQASLTCHLDLHTFHLRRQGQSLSSRDSPRHRGTVPVTGDSPRTGDSPV